MDWTRPIGLLAVLAVVVTIAGALVSLAANPLVGDYATPSVAVVGLVTLAVLAMVAVGTHASGRWLDNPGYW